MNGRFANARDAYRGFHWGRSASRVQQVRLPPKPRELVKLGALEAITYSTTKGDTGFAHYEHEFGEDGGNKPVLAMDPRTKRLHIVEGDYDVEDRGITG